jgi:MerR family transcriptional regulator, light-induced transcriptional regulator
MYSIKEAASRSGVSIPTLRAWERRYGVVEPVRTPSGYRLYDEGAIARLRHMRALVASGWRPREAALRVVQTAESAPAGRPVNGEEGLEMGAAATDAGEAERLRRDFVRAALRYDGPATEEILDDIFSRGSFEWAMETVVFPALEKVGIAWEAGELSVAAEHAASQAVFRRVAMFYEAAARATTSEVVVGLPPGARHDLGALAFAVAARRLGIGILFLGADVPIDSWLSVTQDSGATYAVIAVPTPADVESATKVVRALRGAESAVTCLAGGSAAHYLPDELGAVTLPAPIGEAARVVAAMVTGR